MYFFDRSSKNIYRISYLKDTSINGSILLIGLPYKKINTGTEPHEFFTLLLSDYALHYAIHYYHASIFWFYLWIVLGLSTDWWIERVDPRILQFKSEKAQYLESHATSVKTVPLALNISIRYDNISLLGFHLHSVAPTVKKTQLQMNEMWSLSPSRTPLQYHSKWPAIQLCFQIDTILR